VLHVFHDVDVVLDARDECHAVEELEMSVAVAIVTTVHSSS
jgi:hypothetical protein